MGVSDNECTNDKTLGAKNLIKLIMVAINTNKVHIQ